MQDAMVREADVPADVRTAVARFEPPRGWEALPTPAKNSAQRSLIYFYGCRVRRAEGHGRPETKWFCLASAQCRAGATAISTGANISGCTRHLLVFHGLVSPKTARRATKPAPTPPSTHREARPIAVATAGRTPDGDQEAATQRTRDDDDVQRSKRLEWTRVMIVRHLFSLAPLVTDEQVARLVVRNATGDCDLTEDAVMHHLVECYSATLHNLQGLIQRELERTTLPILHLGLLSASVPGSPCSRSGNSASTLTLLVSFVSSTFHLHQFVLGVTHVIGMRSQSAASVPEVLAWIKAVLGNFGIASTTIRSFVLEQASPLSDLVAQALASDDEAVNHGLGSLKIEFSCDSVAVSALAAACANGSCLRQLLTKLRAISNNLGIHATVVDMEPLEDLASCFGECELDNIPQSKLSSPSLWIAVGRALRWAVRHWQAIESAVEPAQSAPSLSASPESFALSRADLKQSLAILHPVLDSLATGYSQRGKCAGCPEAVVNAFAARLSALNELEPLQLVPIDREGSSDDESIAGSEDAAVVRPADVTGFARKLRHELATQWDVMIQDGVYRADNACLAIFLHPCFRHLEFMDKTQRSAILEQAKTLGRMAVIGQRRKDGSSVFAPSSGHNSSSSLDDPDNNGIEYPRASKKRRTTTEMAKLERLVHQAEELARLGLLKMAKSPPLLDEQSGDGTAVNDSLGSGGSTASLAPSSLSPAFLIANELERYLQNESIAFHTVAFDETLTYWDRKSFEFPILAAVAQAVSGAPRSIRASRSASSFAGRGGCCVRCCLRKWQRRTLPSGPNDADRLPRRRLEEILHFLHLNEELVPATIFVPSLSLEAAAHVLGEATKHHHEVVVGSSSL